MITLGVVVLSNPFTWMMTMTDDRREYWRQRGIDKYEQGVAIIRRLKVMKGCAICGYKAHHAGLDFNHINPDDKTSNIGVIIRKGIPKSRDTVTRKKLSIELSKCEVLCKTCHGIKTFENEHWKKRST